MQNFEAAFAASVVRHRWAIIAVSVLVMSRAMAGVRHLQTDNAHGNVAEMEQLSTYELLDLLGTYDNSAGDYFINFVTIFSPYAVGVTLDRTSDRLFSQRTREIQSTSGI